MSDQDWIIQISPKNKDGSLANIRGRNREDFVAALAVYEEFGPRFGFGQGNPKAELGTPASAPAETSSEAVQLSGVKEATKAGKGPYRIQADQGVFQTFKEEVRDKIKNGVTVVYKRTRFGNDILAVQG